MSHYVTADKDKVPIVQKAAFGAGHLVNNLLPGALSYHLHDWIVKNRVTTFLFEAFDEPWEGGGDSSDPDEVEKHWGVFYENRQPKPSFNNYLKHHEASLIAKKRKQT